RPLRLEAQIADAATPRRDDSPNRAEVRAIGVLLIEPPDDVRSDPDEGAKRRRPLDAVLSAVPGRAKDLRDLLEVVDEEALRLLAESVAFAAGAERLGGEQPLQFLSERRLCDPAFANAEQLDLAVEGGVLAIVEGANDVVRRGEALVAVELAAGERDKVR